VTRGRPLAASRAGLLGAAVALSSCRGPGSALDPAGEGAEQIATLFWGLTLGGALIWVAVVALALYAAYGRRAPISPRGGHLLVVWCGVVVPTVVLAGVLVWSLVMLPGLLATAPDGARRIQVVGHQWWWRVRYLEQGKAPIELANELHLPVGEPVEIELESPDVIHSFWIPSLGGKVDMIPGRKTRIRLRPTRVGTFRGICAEYCGASHALMTFRAVVQDEAAFDAWLAREAAPAAPPSDEAEQRGEEVFQASGCGACHAVRGTPAEGAIGPDLTHVGGRGALAAGALPNDAPALRRWLAHTGDVKPGVHMPSFGMLPEADLVALAAYLEGLE
jgi:cytochrome c oxidase subunit 2